MSTRALYARTAASFGLFAAEAIRLAKLGRSADARWHARHARSDLRALCHLAGIPAPRPHPTADSFAA